MKKNYGMEEEVFLVTSPKVLPSECSSIGNFSCLVGIFHGALGIKLCISLLSVTGYHFTIDYDAKLEFEYNDI